MFCVPANSETLGNICDGKVDQNGSLSSFLANDDNITLSFNIEGVPVLNLQIIQSGLYFAPFIMLHSLWFGPEKNQISSCFLNPS